MKRIIASLLILISGAWSAWSQGSVNWSSPAGLLTWQTNSTQFSPFFGGGATFGGGVGSTRTNSGGVNPSFRFELLYGAEYNGTMANIAPLTIQDFDYWYDSGLSATNATIPGRVTMVSANTAATTPAGWDAGHTNYVILVGWSANLGNTWTTAKANLKSQSALGAIFGNLFFGISSVGRISPNGVGVNPGVTIFGTATNSGQIFSQNAQLYLVNPTYQLPSDLPFITTQPQSQTVAVGSPVTLSIQATNNPPFSYQWYFKNAALPGETNATLNYNATYTNDSGIYYATVSNSFGVKSSTTASLFVYQPAFIVAPLVNQLVSYGSTPSFSVVADGFPTPTNYQWTFNGSPIIGSNTRSLLISNVTTNKLGTYSVTVSNAYGFAQSSATLTMLPSLVTPFAGISGLWGQPGTLSVVAAGSGTLSYQWYKDGIAISGANGSTYFLPSLQLTNSGSYYVVVSSPYGSVTNSAASLEVRPSDTIFGVYAGITVQGTIGNSYSIQYSTDLVNWTTATNIILDQPSANWSDYSSDFRNNAGKYYRVIPTP